MTTPDKQLVEAVPLGGPARGPRPTSMRPSSSPPSWNAASVAASTTTASPPRTRPKRPPSGPQVVEGVAAELGVEVVGRRRPASSRGRSRRPSSTQGGRGEPTAGGARGHRRRHDRDRRPGPDVPQGDRQGRPPDGRGGGRPGQGHRARRADRRGALEGRRLAPRSGPSTTPRTRRARKHPAPAAASGRGGPGRRGPRSRRPSGRPAPAAARLPPDQGRQGRQSEATKTLLRRPSTSSPPTTRRPTRRHFTELLDWAYLAVHNGDLDSRDNVGLRAIYDWTRDVVGLPGARALDPRPATMPSCCKRDGLRPRGRRLNTKLARPPRASSCASAAKAASS